MMKESRTLETFVLFFFQSFSSISTSLLSNVLQIFTPPPPPQQFLFPVPFQNGKKIGGKPGYPPRRVSQHENTRSFLENFI